jgi:stage IV sporulation protein FB
MGRVEVTGGFLLLAAWMNYFDRQGIFPLAMLACLLHEMGHLAVLHWLKKDVKQIRLTAIGAEIALDDPLSYGQEAAAALAGPGANLLTAVVFCRFQWGEVFAGLNLVLGCFNLLPIGQLDGGRVLRCALSVLLEPELSDRVGQGVDAVLTLILLFLGTWLAFFGENISLLLVSVWLMSVFLKIS